LVHGSWHCPEHFEPLIKVLQRQEYGYKCVLVSLPSTQSSDLSPASLEDDTKAVRGAVSSELDAGNDVVVASHSYGGLVSNSSLEGLDKKSRTSAGASTSVTAIVFICAIPLPAGKSMNQNVAGFKQRIHDQPKNVDFANVGEPGPAHYFYNDLAPEEQRKYSAMLRSQSLKAYGGETSHAAYTVIPSWYLYCTKDQAVPMEVQQNLVRIAIEAGAQMKTGMVDASHSPFLSVPEETAEFIMKAAVGSAEA